MYTATDHEQQVFSPTPGVDWLTSPEDATAYIHTVYERRDRLAEEGSILPLAVARVTLDGLEEGHVDQQFESATSTFAKEVTDPRLVRLQKINIFRGLERATRGWHVDNITRPPRTQSFRFILSATHNPDLTTRFAPAGHPISRTLGIQQHQEAPDPSRVVRASGDAISLMPFIQTVHASPEEASPDSVLYNRFAHYLFL